MSFDTVELIDTCPHCGKQMFILINKKAVKTLTKTFKTGQVTQRTIDILLVTPEQKDRIDAGDI